MWLLFFESQASIIFKGWLVMVTITLIMEIIPAHETKNQRKTVISDKQRSKNIYLVKKIPGKGVQIRKCSFQVWWGGGVWGEAGMTQVTWWRCQSNWKNMCLCFRWFYKTLPVTGRLMGCERLHTIWTVSSTQLHTPPQLRGLLST